MGEVLRKGNEYVEVERGIRIHGLEIKRN